MTSLKIELDNGIILISPKTPEMFISLEGIEGCGKSTLLVALTSALQAAGRAMRTAREPGGTPTGDRIREIFLQPGLHIEPLAEALLINASRVHLVAEVVRPALSASQTVICDRFFDSTLAYQGYGRGLDVAFLRDLCLRASGGLVPDVTFVLDIPVDESRRRLAMRHEKRDRMDAQPGDFYERVRSGFLQLALDEPGRFCVLNGALSERELLEEALAHLAALRV